MPDAFSAVDIQVINPLSDPRWDELVERHPRASAFHQKGWLEALVRTYDYEPFALTSSSAGERLNDGIVFCGISSWITGDRFVSLPFADHCEPLLPQPEESGKFVEWLKAECERRKCRYLELRPRTQNWHSGLKPGSSYYFHELDLTPSLEQLFEALHKDSIQRKIRRAEKERLICDTGSSAQHVEEFYRLLLMTRRRHGLFPQPKSWFQNLVACMGDKLQIRLARRNETTVAAMLTLRHRSSVVYKYGCSDERFHSLGGMPFLFWKLIEDSKAAGAEEIDFGRSDLDNEGLVIFKDRFGATRKQLTYLRYANPERVKAASGFNSALIRPFLPLLPDAALSLGGRLLYKHVG
jgi:CelD/BcsL family acetyltransferase involved in cellulose biosynthesis